MHFTSTKLREAGVSSCVLVGAGRWDEKGKVTFAV